MSVIALNAACASSESFLRSSRVTIFCPEPHNPFERILFARAGFLITQDSSSVWAFSIVDVQQL